MRVQVTMPARQAADPSNDDTLCATGPLDVSLLLTLLGLVAVTFALMGYTLATGPDEILTMLRR